MAFDFSDFTCGYKMEEATGAAAIDEAALQDLEDNLSCPGGATGKFGDARGTMDFNSRHLRKAHSNGFAYDIRGLTDIAIAGWFQQNTNFTGRPFPWSIHSGTVATGQAFVVQSGAGASPPNSSPWCAMADGLSLFNWKSGFANVAEDDPIVLDTWTFIAAGWRKATNKVYIFWGKAPGVSYYNEFDGFAAGFGYSGVGAEVKYGFWSGNGTSGSCTADHQLWFNGRALSEAECELLWNNHDGLDFDELVSAIERGRTISAALICRPIDAAALTGRPIDAAALTGRPIVTKNV